MRGKMRYRGALCSALGACVAVGLLGAGPASADPATITFDHGYMKISGSPNPIKIVDDDGSPNPVVLNVNYTVGTSGAFTLSDENHATDFNFPTYAIAVEVAPGVTIPGTMDIQPVPNGAGDITGTYDSATGALSFAADPVKYKAILGAGGTSCEMQPISLPFSTSTATPFAGDLFDVGGPTPLNGAIAASWASLPAPVATMGSQDDCNLLSSFTAKCGGSWLSQGTPTGPPAVVTQPGCEPPADEAPATVKKKKICKKGQKLKKNKCVKKKKKKKKK